jgi:hypothetical protein
MATERKEYNDVYETLMRRANEAGEPLTGMVAYSLYKQSKVEACVAAHAKNGKGLTQGELDTYHLNVGNTVLEAFESRARDSLAEFNRAYMDTRKNELMKEAGRLFVDELSKVEKNIKSDLSAETGFWRGFWPSFASSVAFFLIAAAITFAWTVSNPDIIKGFLNQHAPSAPVVK